MPVVLPNAVMLSTNVRDSAGNTPPTLLSDLHDDPAAPDGLAWTATGAGWAIEWGHASPGPLTGTQSVPLRLLGGTSLYTAAISLYEGVTLVRMLANVAVPLAGLTTTVTFEASEISNPANVRIRVEHDQTNYTDQPFTAQSAWNKPIAAVASASRTAVSASVTGCDVALSPWGGDVSASVPIYVATASDPLVEVIYRDNWASLFNGTYQRSGNTAGSETTIRSQAANSFPYDSPTYASTTVNGTGTTWTKPTSYDPLINPASPPRQIRCPAGCVPGLNSDSAMVVIQPDGTVFESYATIVLADGDVCCTYYKLTNPRLGGDGWQNGSRASLIPAYAGLIKQSELTAGVIPHAIACTISASCLSTATPAHPAASMDRGALSETGGMQYTGAYHMGTRFCLPAAYNIATFGTGIGQMIGLAVQTYGLIVVDRGGVNLINFLTAADITSTTSWNYGIWLDLQSIRDNLQYTTSSPSDWYVSR